MNKRHSERGAVAVIIGLMMVVLVGFIGLAIDFGYAYVKKNQVQNVADAEALACVISPSSAPCPVGTTTGDLYPDVNGYGFTVISTENPGDNSLCPLPATQSHCARVTVSGTWNTFFIPLFGQTTLMVQSVAIAGKQGGGPGCIIASSYFNVSGSQGINGSNCANYFGSVSVNGNPPITGSANYIYNGNAPASCTSCQPPAIGMSGPLTAPTLSSPPYKPSSPGTISGFTGTAATTLTCPNKTTCTLGPGRYNGLDCSNSQSVCHLVPSDTTPAGSTFEFDGTFQGPGNNGTMVGNKVVLYLGGNGQSVTLAGGGSLTLTSPSPTGGPCSGSVTPESQIVIYAPNTGTLNYNGNVASNITGNIYAPGFGFGLGGNGGLTVAGTVVVSSYTDNGGGNSGLTSNGANTCGFTPNGSGQVILVD